MFRSTFNLAACVLALSTGNAIAQDVTPGGSATSWLAGARSHARNVDDRGKAAYLWMRIAYVSNEMGDVPARNDDLRRAFSEAQKILGANEGASAFLGLAGEYLTYRDADGARRCLVEAEGFCRNIANLQQRSERHAHLAGLAFRMKDETGWEKHLGLARDAAKALKAPTNSDENAVVQERLVRCTALAHAWKFDEAFAVAKEWSGKVVLESRHFKNAIEYATILEIMAAKIGDSKHDTAKYEEIYRKAQFYLGRGDMIEGDRERVLWLLTRSDCWTGRTERAVMGAMLLAYPNDRAACLACVVRAKGRRGETSDLPVLLDQIPRESTFRVDALRWYLEALGEWEGLSADQLLAEMGKKSEFGEPHLQARAFLGIALGAHKRAQNTARGKPIQKLNLPDAKTAIAEKFVFEPLQAPLIVYWQRLAEAELERPDAGKPVKQKYPAAMKEGERKKKEDEDEKKMKAHVSALQRARLWTILAGEHERLRARLENPDYRRAIAKAKRAWLESWLDLAKRRIAEKMPIHQLVRSAQPILHALIDIQNVQMKMGDIEGAGETLHLLAKAVEILPPNSGLSTVLGTRAPWLAIVGGRAVKLRQKETGEDWLKSAQFAVKPDYTKQSQLLAAIFAAEFHDLNRCKENAEVLRNAPRQYSENAVVYAASAYAQFALAAARAGDQRVFRDATGTVLGLENERGVLPMHLLPVVEALVTLDDGAEAMKLFRKAGKLDVLPDESLSRIAEQFVWHGKTEWAKEVLERMSPEGNRERVWFALAMAEDMSGGLPACFQRIEKMDWRAQRTAWYLGVGARLFNQASSTNGMGGKRN